MNLPDEIISVVKVKKTPRLFDFSSTVVAALGTLLIIHYGVQRQVISVIAVTFMGGLNLAALREEEKEYKDQIPKEVRKRIRRERFSVFRGYFKDSTVATGLSVLFITIYAALLSYDDPATLPPTLNEAKADATTPHAPLSIAPSQT